MGDPPPADYHERKIDRCIVEQYGLGGLAGRGAVWAGGTWVDKHANGLIRPPKSSPVTNAISYYGLEVFPGLKAPFKAFGTTRVFGMIGRANALVGWGLFAYDLAKIGMCTAQK